MHSVGPLQRSFFLLPWGRGLWPRRVLTFDRPSAGRFLGLTGPLGPRVVVAAGAAGFICRFAAAGSLRSPPEREEHLCLISPCTILLNWTLTSVSRLKGRPLIGQARGQLRLTWRSYAGPPQPPLSGCAGLTQREASHTILRSLPLPYESYSLATPIQGAE